MRHGDHGGVRQARRPWATSAAGLTWASPPHVQQIRFAITCYRLHDRLHASGPKCPASCWPDELPAWPLTWIRDSGGSWHTTRTLGRGGTSQAPLRVELVPPLSRTTTWIETTTTGQSAQIRARLPLRWQ